MALNSNDTPHWVDRFLMSDAAWLAARILVTFLFWLTALEWIVYFSEARDSAELVGLKPPAFWGAVLILFYLVASLMVIFDRMMWLAAGALGVFTFLTIILAHQFWNMTGAEAEATWNEVKEHITVIGGLIGMCIASRQRRRLHPAA